MAIKISGTNVIDNNRGLVNITGATGIYTEFHPAVSSITNTLDFNLPVMTTTLEANTTFSESNKAEGKICLLLLDISTSSYTPTFSGNIKWVGGTTPNWTGYRHWQITLQSIDTTVVRATATGYDATAGGGGGGGGGTAPVAISDNIAVDFSRAGLGGTGNATYRLNSNGAAYRTNTAGSLISITGEWLVSGNNSDYEVQGTFSGTGGVATGPGAGWHNLGTTRDWTLSSTNNFATRDLFIEIRYASNSAVIDSATISFEVDSAP